MFKIGEFSKLTQISIRMLRYYDEEGLLKPAFIDPYTATGCIARSKYLQLIK
jgi:DNA-binding transcriptional MerR regulator